MTSDDRDWTILYDLAQDQNMCSILQNASLDGGSGIAPNDPLVGTPEFFESIAADTILETFVEGKVTRVFMSGHDDYPVFELTTRDGKTSTWERAGDSAAYREGMLVRVYHVELPMKPDSVFTPVLGDTTILVTKIMRRTVTSPD